MRLAWWRVVAGLHAPRPARALPLLRSNWPYVALLVVIVLPLLWMAVWLAIRSGLFGLSGGATIERQTTTFLTFIGGGLATAATVFGALLTRAHNVREHRRLQLEAVLQSLNLLPAPTRDRMAGVLPAMVLLGQQRIALRVLEPAWEAKEVDHATATWVLGQVLGEDQLTQEPTGERRDDAALHEAAVLLRVHARRGDLTEPDQPRVYYFPGQFGRRWNRALPRDVNMIVLQSAACVLLSRSLQWWEADGDLPVFPTEFWLDCVAREPDPVLRSSAALLLDALWHAFPQGKAATTPRRHRVEVSLGGHRAWVGSEEVPQPCRELARAISSAEGSGDTGRA